jgi:HEAT repeat protein
MVQAAPITPEFVSTLSLDVSEPDSTWDEVKRALHLPFTASKLRPVLLRDGDPAAIPVLIELLRDDNPRARLYACQTLGSFGPAASGAVLPLREALRDHEVGAFGITVSTAAAEALEQIDPSGAKALAEQP